MRLLLPCHSNDAEYYTKSVLHSTKFYGPTIIRSIFPKGNVQFVQMAKSSVKLRTCPLHGSGVTGVTLNQCTLPSCIEWKCKLLKVPTYQGLFRAATCYVALQSSLASFSARLITLLVFPAHVSPYTRRKSTSASTCPTSPFSTSVR